MASLLESPWPAIWFGLCALALLGVAYLNTRRGLLLVLLGVALAISGAGILVEWLVVTDVEEVENTLQEVADALESNDLTRVQSFLDPGADVMRRRTEQYLPLVKVTQVKISDIKVRINRLIAPPTATVQFFGRISFESRSAAVQTPYGNLIRPFTVKLRKSGKRWLLTGYVDGVTNTQFNEPGSSL